MGNVIKMGANDRKELRKLVDERFDLITEKLDATVRHIRNGVQERIESEAEEALEAARAKTAEFHKQAEQIEQDLAAAIEKLEAEAKDKVRAIGAEFTAYATEQKRKHKIEADSRYKRRGRRSSYDGSEEGTLESADELEYIDWSVLDLDDKIQREMDKVMATKGDARAALREQRNEMLTEITIGGLESEAAREFLAKIPTLGTLLNIEKANEYIQIEGAGA
jgi:RNA-binding protein YhbY